MCEVRIAKGKWPVSLLNAHINFLELLSISSIETFCAVPKKSPHCGQIRQHNDGGIYKLTRENTFSPASQSSTKNHVVGHEAFSFITDDSCPGNNECGGRSPVQGESSVRHFSAASSMLWPL